MRTSPVAPERIRGTRPEQSPGKNFCHAPPLFGSTSTISRFGERFRDGQYSQFLVDVLLLTGSPRAL